MGPVKLHRAARTAEGRADLLCAARAEFNGHETRSLNRQVSEALGEAADANRACAAWWLKVSIVALVVAAVGFLISAIAQIMGAAS